MRVIEKRTGLVAAAVTALALMNAPTAAAAADPATIGVGCNDAGFWETTVTAAAGDTVTLVGAGSALDTCTLDLGTVATAASTSFHGDESLVITIVHPGTISVSTTLSPTSAPTLTIVSPPDSAPADILQQVPLPAAGSCDRVDEAGLSYGSGVSGGWSRSWAHWTSRGSGGDVCTRTLTYSMAQHRWVAV